MKSNHIHKFKRDTYSTGKKFYYCINGDCTFKCDVKHSLGKTSLCNNCGNPFAMNEYSIRKANPKCMDCVKRRTIRKDGVLEEPIVKETKSDSISELRAKMGNLSIKEYNPEDESDEL